jgi:universal stress protein A
MIPPARVLAAIDFSETSRTALGFAARLARQSNAELHLVHAVDPLLATASETAGLNLADDAREELMAFTGSTSLAAEYSPRCHVIVGEASDTILTIAARERADIIVVGAHGMSGAAKPLFGSVTECLLRRAELPILVVPDGWSAPSPATDGLSGIGPVIAGIDLTAASIEAAAAAARLAHVLGTGAVLVHVVQRPRVLERWRRHAEAAVTSSVECAQRDLHIIEKSLATDVPVRLRVEVGDVPEKLVRIAQRSSRGIIVLGRALRSAGHGPPGAIAYRVLMKARVPTLMYVVPRRGQMETDPGLTA